MEKTCDLHYVPYERYEKKLNKGRGITINSWYYRMPELVDKHRLEIVQILKIKKIHRQYADQLFASNKGGVVIGVHLRRGDYRLYADGKFYIDDKKIICLLKGFLEDLLLSGHENLTLVIFSNEQICEKEYRNELEKATLIFSHGNTIEDLYGMTQCDYLIAPKSSFSWWGAYAGSNKLCIIDSNTQSINLDSFKAAQLGKY